LFARWFVTPALAVLGYLRQLSTDPAAPVPRLGERWQGWVDAVRNPHCCSLGWRFSATSAAATATNRPEAESQVVVDTKSLKLFFGITATLLKDSGIPPVTTGAPPW
jgi:hypothetical protein